MDLFNIQKPFLKWVGGKSQILDKILGHFPSKMNNYHEIFLGGGSVLLALLSLQKRGSFQIEGDIYAYDLNPYLINVYHQIQTQPKKFYKFLSEYWNTYGNLSGTIINRQPQTLEEAKSSKESYYYWVRNYFNQMDKLTPEGAAVFVFLNKTCFRGLYREGPQGFNVPYGHYKKTPVMMTPSELENVHQLIQNVKFKHSPFQKSLSGLSKGDFIYLDPPYVPENPQSFVKYTHDGFNLETHQELFRILKELHQQKIKLVLSNSNVELVLDTFRDFSMENLQARRAINAKKPGSTTTEVIIYN